MRRSAAGFSKRYPLAANTVIRNKPIMFKKIPAGCPAGEGGMVEEIYIHYYRHLVQEKVTPFWKKNARNCSGGLLDLPPPQNRTYGLNLKVLSGSCSRWISWQFLQLFWSSPAGAFAASRLF